MNKRNSSIYKDVKKYFFYDEQRDSSYGRSYSGGNSIKIQDGYFPYIPVSLSYLIEIFDLLIEGGVVSLNTPTLEIGSGIGRNLFILEKYFKYKTIHGIEVNREFFTIGNFLLYNAFKKIDYVPVNHVPKTFLVDAFDFENYENYDHIFMYIPISNRDLMRNLYLTIFNKVKIGTIITEFSWASLAVLLYENAHKHNIIYKNDSESYFGPISRSMRKIGINEFEEVKVIYS